MSTASRSFQIFAKPAGAACNLACRYCYYLRKGRSVRGVPLVMPKDLLCDYIAQHITACPDEIIRFSWHGGEPTVLGLDYFRSIVEIQRRLQPPGRVIANGMLTNGTLLNEEWGRFLAAEHFAIGLSLDGPMELHDPVRVTRDGRPTFNEAIRGYEILRRHNVPTDILCVVGAHNVRHPDLVYGFFRRIGASYVSLLPLVERRPDSPSGVSAATPPAEAWGEFLCSVFDEWVAADIGRIKVQIIEEATRTAFGQEHSLCLFRPVCGDIPVVESNGDFYPCDHFVEAPLRVGNIRETPLVELLESDAQKAFGQAKRAGLPSVCRSCEVLEMCQGECPKNRFVQAQDGEPGLNYLCPGYKRFFNHVTPFVVEVAAAWHRQLS